MTTDAMLTLKTWDRVHAVTQGTKFGAILASMFDKGRDATPRFLRPGTITSDGYLLCDFVTQHGEHKMGAFVGSASDLDRNIEGVIAHLNLTQPYAGILRAKAKAWIGRDWRVL